MRTQVHRGSDLRQNQGSDCGEAGAPSPRNGLFDSVSLVMCRTVAILQLLSLIGLPPAVWFALDARIARLNPWIWAVAGFLSVTAPCIVIFEIIGFVHEQWLLGLLLGTRMEVHQNSHSPRGWVVHRLRDSQAGLKAQSSNNHRDLAQLCGRLGRDTSLPDGLLCGC